MIKAWNLQGRTGDAVKNQIVVEKWNEGKHECWFCSYGRTVAHISAKGVITFDKTGWNYSTTTGKYLNQFMREFTPYDTGREAVKANVVKFADLNR